MHLKVPMGLWSTIQYAVGSYGKVLSKRFIKVIQWTCNDQAMKQKDTWQRKSAEQATIIINVPNTVNNKNTSQDHSGKNLITKSIFPMITCISCNFLRKNTLTRRGRKLGNVAYFHQRRRCVDSYISTFSDTLDCACLTNRRDLRWKKWQIQVVINCGMPWVCADLRPDYTRREANGKRRRRNIISREDAFRLKATVP